MPVGIAVLRSAARPASSIRHQAATDGIAARRMPRAALALFGIALALRLAMIPFAGIYHPDELFQYLEQAHRLLFGHGVVPWEYRLGMRSWLMPLAIAPPMALGDELAPGTSLYLLLPRALAASLSMATVWATWRIGRCHSAQHGLIALAAAACWGEFVYLAPHILSETFSVALILPAAVLVRGAATPRKLMLAGLLCAGAALLRIQHLPAITTLAILSLWGRPAAWAPFFAGAMAGLLGSAVIDVAVGQVPFGWAIEYVRQNILNHRADAYGVSAPWAYAQGIAVSLGWWTAPILALAAIGARREPTLFRVALVNLAVHMLIAHKEYRFILLTTAILMILAAVGSGELLARMRRRWQGRSRSLLWSFIAAWAIISATLGLAHKPARYATLDAYALEPFEQLRRDPGLCGLAISGMHFSAGGGYAYLHRSVPIYAYAPGEDALLRQDIPGFDRIVAPSSIPAPPGFRRTWCRSGGEGYPSACIFVRPGHCRPIVSIAEINRQLVRTGQ